MKLRSISLSILTAAFTIGLAAAAEPVLDEHLELFRPLLGKTYRGEFIGGAPGPGAAEMVDIAKWERALNGKAIRVLHSVNDGVYGGESITRWDAEKKQLVSNYFTTEGFTTTGTKTVEGGKVTSVEKVSGNAGGVTEVRAVMEIRADGTIHVKAEYFKGAEKAGGREVIYKEDAKAEVKFR